MHLCDKCVKFNRCFPKGTMPTEEKRAGWSSTVVKITGNLL